MAGELCRSWGRDVSVSRYGKFGLIGSGKIARKFADAPAIGFMCGRRNGITSLDCDSKDACRSLGDIDTAMGCFKRSYEIDSFDPEIAALR